MGFLLDRKVLFTLLLPLAALACSGSNTAGSGGTGGGGNGGAGGDPSTSSSGGTGGTGGAAGGSGGSGAGNVVECEGPGYGGNEQEVNVGIVKAIVLDQNGSPAAQAPVQVCGTDICKYGTTSDSGSVTVIVNGPLKAPAFKYGDGITYAKLAVAVAAGDTDYGEVVTAKLPDVGDGEKFEAGKSVTSAGVTIDVAAGASIEIDALSYPEDIDQLFRAVEIPLGANVPAVDPALGLEAVFGVAPLETVFCPAVTVHVPNTPMWAAGTEVELLIQGLDILQHWAPYTQWQKVSDGVVSADGKEIVTSDGQGLPLLSTFGVRLKK